jgi:Seryl-tRNA synthetase
MLDIKKMRTDPDHYKERLATRGVAAADLDAIFALDAKRRELIQQTETLKAQRNEVSKQIAQAKRNKESADDAIAAMKKVGEDIKALDDQLNANDIDFQNKMAHLPNMPHDGIPVGKG